MNIEQKADEIYRDLLKDPNEVLRLLMDGFYEYDGLLGDLIVLGNKVAVFNEIKRIINWQANIEAMKEAQRLAELEYMGSDLEN